MAQLLISIITGVIFGNLAGGLLKTFNLGIVGNSVAGVIGCWLGKQILQAPNGGVSSGMASELISCLLGAIALVVLAGMIKNQLAR